MIFERAPSPSLREQVAQDVAVFAGGLVQVDSVVQGSVAVEAGAL